MFKTLQRLFNFRSFYLIPLISFVYCIKNLIWLYIIFVQTDGIFLDTGSVIFEVAKIMVMFCTALSFVHLFMHHRKIFAYDSANDSFLEQTEESSSFLWWWRHQHWNLILVGYVDRARWLHPRFSIDLHGECLPGPYHNRRALCQTTT